MPLFGNIEQSFKSHYPLIGSHRSLFILTLDYHTMLTGTTGNAEGGQDINFLLMNFNVLSYAGSEQLVQCGYLIFEKSDPFHLRSCPLRIWV